MMNTRIERPTLASLITPERVWLPAQTPDKKTLVETLTLLACAGRSEVDPREVAVQVLKREAEIPTVLETGLAIPHARVEELTGFAAAVAVLPEPLEDVSGDQTRIMFLFLSPMDSSFFPKHLQLLGSLASTFTPAFVAALSKQQHAAGVAALFAGR